MENSIAKESLFDGLRFNDFPHEFAGQEGLCKYTIRAWLIGRAILSGYHYQPANLNKGEIRRNSTNEVVTVEVVHGGILLSDPDSGRSELVETRH